MFNKANKIAAIIKTRNTVDKNISNKQKQLFKNKKISKEFL